MNYLQKLDIFLDLPKAKKVTKNCEGCIHLKIREAVAINGIIGLDFYCEVSLGKYGLYFIVRDEKDQWVDKIFRNCEERKRRKLRELSTKT